MRFSGRSFRGFHGKIALPLCLRFCLAALLAGTSGSVASAQHIPSFSAAMAPVLKEFDEQSLPPLRTAYLNWATNVVLGELRQARQTVPEDCLAEVAGDADLRDAMFRSVYPPDPSVLQNYARLRLELGAGFVAKHHSLVIAAAVARRIKGVEISAGKDGSVWFGQFTDGVGGDHDAEGNYQPGFWTDESLQAVGSPAEKEFVAAIANYMKTNQIAALALYTNEASREHLAAVLKDRGISDSLIGELKQGVQFGERLKNAMVLLGQRPGAREKKPGETEWLHHLAAICEATPQSTPLADGKPMPWPIFPIDQAPWPLLMPLARPVPLSEANYVWEAFQGEHGSDRYHTYGPYRGDADAMPCELQPSPWFWDAWPDRILHGGECVPLSKGTVDLYSCLAKPAVWAGQPGHANVITYRYDHGAWTADNEQAFAGGPDVTFAQWYFDDRPGTKLRFRDLYNWAGAEYHFGLALGMNRGLQSYLDTRMAANIFSLLPAHERQTTGRKLLESALATNPFNPEICYLLAALSPDPLQGMAFVQSLMKQERDRIGYWQTVDEFAAHYAILDRAPPAKEADLLRLGVFLRGVPGLNTDDLKAYTAKFYQERADRGDPRAELRMGERYQDGVGVPRDEARARDYFTKAAALGNAEAARELRILNSTIPAGHITITVSSQAGSDQDMHHLLDGAGMYGGLHDNDGSARTMWHTVSHPAPQPPAPGLAPSPAWVRFDFAEPETLWSILIWNLNQAKLTDRDFHKTRIYGTSDGNTWFPLTSTETIDLPRVPGEAGLPAQVIPNAAQARPIKSVIIAADAVEGNYGSDCFGLSAVRFLGHP